MVGSRENAPNRQRASTPIVYRSSMALARTVVQAPVPGPAVPGHVGKFAVPRPRPPRLPREELLVTPMNSAYEKMGRMSRPLKGVISTLAMIAKSSPRMNPSFGPVLASSIEAHVKFALTLGKI